MMLMLWTIFIALFSKQTVVAGIVDNEVNGAPKFESK